MQGIRNEMKSKNSRFDLDKYCVGECSFLSLNAEMMLNNDTSQF